jgi:tetratricopeptide (TPR) repeat protein
VKLYPQDERVQNLLAAHYFGQQDYQKSIEHYSKAIEINPAFSTPYNQLGYAQRFLSNYKEAEIAFKKYIELIPEDPNPYDSYAELLMKMGKYDQSIDTYKKALVFNPNFVASYIGIATNLNFQGMHQQAREQLKKLYKTARNDGERRAAHFATAVSYVDEGKMDEAINELEKQYALAQKINDAGAMAGDLIVMGNIYLEKGNFDQASKRFEKALDVAKNSKLSEDVKDNFYRGYLYNITRTAVKKNDLLSAKKTAQKYRQMVEQIQNPFQIRLSHETWAMIALAEKNYDKALEGFQKSNLQNPYNLYHIALVYQGKGDQEQAKGYFQRAKEFNGLNNINYAFVRNLL